MLIGLAGYATVGKDAVAEILVRDRGFTRVAFADAVREAVYTLDPQVDGFTLRELVDGIGWDKAKAHTEVRRLLQAMGTELARKTWRDDFWVALLMDRYTGQDWVVSDCRFINEVNAIQVMGGKVYRIERPGVGPINDHVSETGLDSFTGFDDFILNHGTLEDLAVEVKRVVR